MSVIKDILQQPKKLCQAPANELTPEEIAWVHSMYYACPTDPEGKLILNQIQHMPNEGIYTLCYWVDSAPFVRSKVGKWSLERSQEKIVVRSDIYSYHIIIDTGNVHVYIDGRLTTTSNNGNAIQFHMKHYNAFPVFFEEGHWANGRNAFQLGMAVPNMQPIHDALGRLFDKDKALAQQWLFDKKLDNIDFNDVQVYNNELTEINKQLARLG